MTNCADTRQDALNELVSLYVALAREGFVLFKFPGFEALGPDRVQGAFDSASGMHAGVQEIAAVMGELTRKAVEDSNIFVGKIGSVGSFSEAVTMQTEFARTSIETMVANTREIGDMYSALAAQMFKPFA